MQAYRTHNSPQTATSTERRTHALAIWPSAIVLFSLAVFLSRQIALERAPDAFALAYVPPAIASLCAAVYAWLRYRHESSGWWLGCAASFFLFFSATGQQLLLEAGGVISSSGAVSPSVSHPMPWQPWIAGRLLLALGMLSAFSAPRSLLAQGGPSGRQAVMTVGALSLAVCPLWAARLFENLYVPAAHGLTAIDSVVLVLSGFALIFAFARARREMTHGDPFNRLLYVWFLALGWSAACRAFPFGDIRTAVWVEMLVVGAASMVLCAQLVWLIAGGAGQSGLRLRMLEAAHDVLRSVASVRDEDVAGRLAWTACEAARAGRAMVLIRLPDSDTVTVAGVFPESETDTQVGTRLDMARGFRKGFADGPAARAMSARRTLVVTDTESDVVFVHWREFTDSPAYQVSIPFADGSESFGALLLWFPDGRWRPWECVPLAEEVVEACLPLLSRLPSLYASIELEREAQGVA